MMARADSASMALDCCLHSALPLPVPLGSGWHEHQWAATQRAPTAAPPVHTDARTEVSRVNAVGVKGGGCLWAHAHGRSQNGLQR